jgi:hypothetical protein
MCFPNFLRTKEQAMKIAFTKIIALSLITLGGGSGGSALANDLLQEVRGSESITDRLRPISLGKQPYWLGSCEQGASEQGASDSIVVCWVYSKNGEADGHDRMKMLQASLGWRLALRGQCDYNQGTGSGLLFRPTPNANLTIPKKPRPISSSSREQIDYEFGAHVKYQLSSEVFVFGLLANCKAAFDAERAEKLLLNK